MYQISVTRFGTGWEESGFFFSDESSALNGAELVIDNRFGIGVGLEVRDNQLVALLWPEGLLEDDGLVETVVLSSDFRGLLEKIQQRKGS